MPRLLDVYRSRRVARKESHMWKFVATGLKNVGATFIDAPIVIGGNSVASCISADLLPFWKEAT